MPHKNPVFLVLGCYLVLIISTTTLAASDTDLRQPAQRAFELGQFEKAIVQWESILPNLSSARQQVNVLLQLAAAYQSLGLAEKSVDLLEKALPIAEQIGDNIRQSLVLGSLSDLSLLMGDLDEATKLAARSHKLVCTHPIQNPLACATALNYQGNVLSTQGDDLKDALEKYKEALNQLQSATAPVFRAKLLCNIVQLEFNPDNFKKALSQMEALPDSHDKVFGLLKLGYLAIERPEIKPIKVYEILQDALQLAKRLSDTRAVAYATGYLGKLYLKDGREKEAESLIRQAIFLTNAPDMQYLWQWQLGRLRHAQNNLPAAIAAYQQAVNHLETIRNARVRGYRSPPEPYFKTAEQVYYELANLHLQVARRSSNQVQRQRELRKARKTLELLKAVELENYFQDDCVTKLQAKRQNIDDILTDVHTAVLYPMIFSERVELLLSFSDNRLEQFSVNKPQELVLKQVADFRQALKFRKKDRQNFYRQVLPAAKTLYTTLIAPIAARLEQRQVDTLIVVPDSQLRTIPFAALYDDVKKVFLIEKYALAITPGLILTQAPKTFERDINLLMAGLSEQRSGFNALPDALKTIQAIENQQICPQIAFTALKNEQFQIQRLADNLKQVAYNLIYFSTHAQFDKNSTKSFVLTYNERLSLDDLENLIRSTQFRDDPVELLVLSACETASGERAALGLAGVAVKTGAISAVGSLWKVADESTARLMESFFRELCDNPTLSKAKAFQNAQNKLLSEYKEYPFYWAPFLLIGNWF